MKAKAEKSAKSPCIACGDETNGRETIMFMERQLEFPICDRCRPCLGAVFGDKEFGEAQMRFLGVTQFDQIHRNGGAFSGSSSVGVVPPNLSEKLDDFNLFCQFLGARIRMHKSSTRRTKEGR